jgi:hypothetical protein
MPGYLGTFERNGANGSSVTTGVGGLGGRVFVSGGKDPDQSFDGGNGGNSAGIQAGNSGSAGTVSNVTQFSTQVYAGGSGGAVGYAILTNGNTVTYAVTGTITGTVG